MNPPSSVTVGGVERPNRRSATRQATTWNPLPSLVPGPAQQPAQPTPVAPLNQQQTTFSFGGGGGGDSTSAYPQPDILDTPAATTRLYDDDEDEEEEEEDDEGGMDTPESSEPATTRSTPAPPPLPVSQLRRSARLLNMSTSPVPFPSHIPQNVITGQAPSQPTKRQKRKRKAAVVPDGSRSVPDCKLKIPRKRQRNNNLDQAGKRNIEKVLQKTIGTVPKGPCDFCRLHPQGKAMYARTGKCNFEVVVVHGTGRDTCLIQCQNCADYRSTTGDTAHVCVVDSVKFPLKRYGSGDPKTYPAVACQRCVNFHFQATCDVDTILGYKCSNCRQDYPCFINDVKTPVKRPIKIMPVRPWYRHACERCRTHALEDGRLDNVEKCSWIDNRDEWEQDKACSRCVREGKTCIDTGNLIREVNITTPPDSWAIDEGYANPWDLAEITRHSVWRKPCDACLLSNTRCQVRFDRGSYACERCSQIGVGCITDLGVGGRTYWPLYSLALVGFGPHVPFTACKNCRINDRPCDRQRPCDSCVSNGEKSECDSWLRTMKENTLPRPWAGSLGPLYYLATGFAGDTFLRPKTGLGPEDWIGPATARWAVDKFEKDWKGRTEVVVSAHKAHRPPAPAKPPHGAPGGQLLNKVNMQDWTPQELQDMVRALWPNCAAPGAAALRSIAYHLENDVPLNPPVRGAVPNTGYRKAVPRATRRPETQTQAQTQLQLAQNQIQAGVVQPAHIQQQLQSHGFQPQLPPQPQLHNPFIQQQQQFNPQGLQQPWQTFDPNQFGNTNIPPGSYFDDQQQQYPDPFMDQQIEPDQDDQYGSQLDVIADWNQRQDDMQRQRQQSQQNRFGNNDGGYGRSMRPAVGIRDLPEAPPRARQVLPDLSSESSGRVPRHAKAAAKAPFNPFLGFALIGGTKLRYNTKPKNSRWKAFNPLEDLDMSHWHTARRDPEKQSTGPGIFSTAEGQSIPVPSRDVLRDVPREEAEQRVQHRCVEPGDGGFGSCERDNAFRINCQSLAHSNTPPYHFPVCNQCHVASVNDLFRQENKPITRKDLISMRAYLCHDCAEHISSEAQNVLSYRDAGARTVHGIYTNGEEPRGIHQPGDNPDNTVEFRPDPQPGTGCFCADKVLGGWLCRFHRLYYAEEMLKESKLMHEWRLSYFKRPVCPGCLANKPLSEVNVSADHRHFEEGGPTAWACLTCSEWVVNQENDEYNRPEVVKGALKTAERITDLLARVTELPEDVEMGG